MMQMKNFKLALHIPRDKALRSPHHVHGMPDKNAQLKTAQKETIDKLGGSLQNKGPGLFKNVNVENYKERPRNVAD